VEGPYIPSTSKDVNGTTDINGTSPIHDEATPPSSFDPEEVLPSSVLDLSQSPQVLSAPASGRSSVKNPPRKRARLQGPTGLMSGNRSNTSFSPTVTPKPEVQGNGTEPPQPIPVLNFEQSSGLCVDIVDKNLARSEGEGQV